MQMFQKNEPAAAAIARRISPDQPNYFQGYRVDRRLYSKLPIRSCDIVRRGKIMSASCDSLRLVHWVFVTCQKYLGQPVCGLDPASVSRAVKICMR